MVEVCRAPLITLSASCDVFQVVHDRVAPSVYSWLQTSVSQGVPTVDVYVIPSSSCCDVATDHRLLFNLVSQYRRHEAAAQSARSVKVATGPRLAAVLQLLNAPDIVQRILDAERDPASPQAKELFSVLLPVLTTTGAAVPFSAAARKQCLGKIMSMVGDRVSMWRPATCRAIAAPCSYHAPCSLPLLLEPSALVSSLSHVLLGSTSWPSLVFCDRGSTGCRLGIVGSS